MSISSGANSGRSVTTNSTGDYRFDTLSAGSASVAARAVGYQTDTRAVDITGAAALNFSLLPVTDPFTGTWEGSLESLSCSADGNFGQGFCSRYPSVSDVTTPAISTIKLVLVQSGNTIGGTSEFNRSWKLDVKGGVTGGRLSWSDNKEINSGLTFAVESWDSTVSGSTMSGDFAIRFYATAGSPSGSARYRVRLLGVTRTQ